MKLKTTMVGLVCAAAGAAVVSVTVAEPQDPAPQFQLPPGWTEADMQACIIAGTPGQPHAELLTQAGVWEGTGQMWMGPGSEPMAFDCTMTVTPMMDGRYIKTQMAGDMPGMGPYTGLGISGYDNVAARHVSIWVDNHSTGIMRGTGDQSADGTLTWAYEHMCPVTRKPTVMREIERIDGNKRTLEMHGKDPKSGVEYKIMAFELARKP